MAKAGNWLSVQCPMDPIAAEQSVDYAIAMRQDRVCLSVEAAFSEIRAYKEQLS